MLLFVEFLSEKFNLKKKKKGKMKIEKNLNLTEKPFFEVNSNVILNFWKILFSKTLF